MITREENDLLTQVGPGTPMGDLFRRFWLPVAVVDDVAARDGSPHRVKVLGEDLVLFRDTDGRFGLVGAYCPHRGAPLEYGRNEECGLRCIYHGWKFDVTGQCVDMPNVARGETASRKQRITAYPVIEQGGMVWAYMGPAEHQPPFPMFPFRDASASHVYTCQFEVEANWLQTIENEFDFCHGLFLHSAGANQSQAGNIVGIELTNDQGAVEFLELKDTPTGVTEAAKIRFDGRDGGHMIHYLFPSFMAVGVAPPEIASYNLRTPVDDETTMMFRVRCSSDEPLDPALVAEWRTGGYEFPRLIPGTHRPEANRDTRYRHDPVVQRQFNYTGTTSFLAQDMMVVEDLWGRRADRTKEHLVASDRPVIHLRRRLLKTVRELAETGAIDAPMAPEGYAVRQVGYLFPEGEEFDRDRCLAELDALSTDQIAAPAVVRDLATGT